MWYFILFIIVIKTNCGHQFAVCSAIYAVTRPHLEMYRKQVNITLLTDFRNGTLSRGTEYTESAMVTLVTL